MVLDSQIVHSPLSEPQAIKKKGMVLLLVIHCARTSTWTIVLLARKMLQ